MSFLPAFQYGFAPNGQMPQQSQYVVSGQQTGPNNNQAMWKLAPGQQPQQQARPMVMQMVMYPPQPGGNGQPMMVQMPYPAQNAPAFGQQGMYRPINVFPGCFTTPPTQPRPLNSAMHPKFTMGVVDPDIKPGHFPVIPQGLVLTMDKPDATRAKRRSSGASADKPKRVKKELDNDEDDEGEDDSATSDGSSEPDRASPAAAVAPKKPRAAARAKSGDSPAPSSLQGDRRLIIHFEQFGSKGALPQRFGKSGLLIPDGLVGTHTVYQERWRFEIHHTQERVPGTDSVCITWKITNIKTGESHSRTETAEEAESRVSLGWTISSKLFRDAMSHRANELENGLAGETNECRIANIKSLIKTLRPKTFTQGPLIFGLKHRIVQEKIGNAGF